MRKSKYDSFLNSLSKNDAIELLKKFKYKKDLFKYLGISGQANGERILKEIVNKTGKSMSAFYPSVQSRKDIYNLNPNRCVQCGRDLDYKHRNNKFCSTSCAATYNNIRREKKLKICQNCGNLIESDKIYHNKFCNKNCEIEYKYRKPENEKINRWLKGENFIIGHAITPRFIKRYLMSLYNNKCQVCGWGETNIYSNTIPLQIHHIDGDCTNNQIENLQILCPNCHSLTSTNGSLNKNSRRFHKSKITK